MDGLGPLGVSGSRLDIMGLLVELDDSETVDPTFK